MGRSDYTGIRSLNSMIEIHHPRFETLHAPTKLMDRLAQQIKLLTGARPITLEVSH